MQKDAKLYNLTKPQLSIWLTEQFYQGTNINTVSGTMTVLEAIDFVKFKAAINKFVENNDSYRIIITMNNNNVMQYVSPYVPFELEMFDVTSEDELNTIAREFCSIPFDILDSTLFEFKLYRFPDGHGGFTMKTHHIITDSWTIGIMVNEIIFIYNMLLKNETIEDVKKDEFSYISYIDSEQEYVNSEKFQKDKEYWNSLYNTIPEQATIPSTNLDYQHSDSAESTRIELPINKKLLARINSYCSENSISIFNFFMSVFSIYLGRVSNLEDFVIGTPILNRSNFKEKRTARYVY